MGGREGGGVGGGEGGLAMGMCSRGFDSVGHWAWTCNEWNQARGAHSRIRLATLALSIRRELD